MNQARDKPVTKNEKSICSRPAREPEAAPNPSTLFFLIWRGCQKMLAARRCKRDEPPPWFHRGAYVGLRCMSQALPQWPGSTR